nr:hypothetical protein [uncultured bacterium]
MRYQEYKPPIELATWIKLFWVFESRSNDPVPETNVADGIPELILHFRSPYAEVDRSGQFLKQPAAVACGQLTRPLVLHGSLDAGMIGIRFQPSGMRTHSRDCFSARVSIEYYAMRSKPPPALCLNGNSPKLDNPTWISSRILLQRYPDPRDTAPSSKRLK